MSEETVNGYIRHKDIRHLRLYLDYIGLYQGNEHKAKIIRIIETWTNTRHEDWIKTATENKERGRPISEPNYWITMSYQQFCIFMYGTSREETIKKNVQELLRDKHIERRVNPDDPYGPPQYRLNKEVLQAALDALPIPSDLPDLERLADLPRRKTPPPPKDTPTPGMEDTPSQGVRTLSPGGKDTPTLGVKTATSNNSTKNLPNNTPKRDSSVTTLADDTLTTSSFVPSAVQSVNSPPTRSEQAVIPIDKEATSGGSSESVAIGNSRFTSDDEEDDGSAPTEPRLPALRPSQTQAQEKEPPRSVLDGSQGTTQQATTDTPGAESFSDGNSSSHEQNVQRGSMTGTATGEATSSVTRPDTRTAMETTSQDSATSLPLPDNKTTRGRKNKKMDDISAGPPSMPPEDAQWDAETLVQVLEAHRGRRYPNGAKRKSGRVRDVELESASALVEMHDLWTGSTALNMKRLLKIVQHLEDRRNGWWLNNVGHVMPHHLVDKDRVHEMLDEMRRLKQAGVSMRQPMNGGPMPEAIPPYRRIEEIMASWGS